MNNVNNALLLAIALISYGTSFVKMLHEIVLHLNSTKILTNPTQIARYQISRLAKRLIYLALITHLCVMLGHSFFMEGIDLQLVNTLNYVGWFMLFWIIVLTNKNLSSLISLLLVGLNTLCLLLVFLTPESNPTLVVDLLTGIHALLSLFAYSLCAMTAIQALIWLLQERSIRYHTSWWWLGLIPTLQSNEKLFSQLTLLALSWLTLAVLSGGLILDDWISQQVSHKTVFTLLAWLAFAVLTIGKSRFSVSFSAKWAISSFSLLLIGFVGSKFVLEFLLI